MRDHCNCCGCPCDEQDSDDFGWCEDCVADPTCEVARHSAEKNYAAERKIEDKKTARQDAEYRSTHDD